MTHGDKMLTFLKVGTAKKVKGYAECDICYAAVEEYVVLDNKAIFTCPNGHENK